MKKVSILAILIALTALSMQAAYGQSVDCDFTADEGFTAGSVGAHSDWLDKDSDYQVDPSGSGLVSINGATTYRKAINQTAFSSNTQYSVGIKFTFDRIFTNAFDKNVISIGFKETQWFNGDRVDMQLTRGFYDDEFKLKMGNSGSPSPNLSTGGFSEELLGFSTNETSSSSDDLWFEYTITRGVDAPSWTGYAVLSNMTTGVEIKTFNVSFDSTANFFNDDSIYACINSVNSDAQTFTSNRKVDRFIAGVDNVEVFEQFEDVEFTAEQGYESGSLFGQQGFWSGNADQADTVVDATTNYVMLTTNTYKQMTYTLPLSTTNGVLEVGGEFRFDRTISAVAEGPAVTFNMVENLNAYPKFMRLEFRRASSDQFVMKLSENVNGFNVSSDLIAESTLGLDGGVDNDSTDDLQISLKLYPGVSTNDWSAAVVLSNLTAGTEVESFSVDPGLFIVKESWTNSILYGGFNSSGSEADTGTLNRQIERFYVAAGTAMVVTPSPYESWLADYQLTGTNALADANPDGDALSNLEEYGLGGNPTNGAYAGYAPIVGTMSEGGTNYFSYAHVMLTNLNSGISYIVETRDDLMSGSWTNSGILQTVGPFDSTFNVVTNRISMEGQSAGFMRLRIVED